MKITFWYKRERVIIFSESNCESSTMILLLAVLLVAQSASASIFLDCTYSMVNWDVVGSVYACRPNIVRIDDSRNVVGVSQNHQTGMTNAAVQALNFQNQQIDFIPEDIHLFFPNIAAINFNNCPVRSFTKDDLIHFPRLKFFRIGLGQLTRINGDVFKYTPDLEYLALGRNQITNVGSGLIQSVPKLITARFASNLCIDNDAVTPAAVAILAQELASKCPPTAEMAGKIILQGENLHQAVNE